MGEECPVCGYEYKNQVEITGKKTLRDDAIYCSKQFNATHTRVFIHGMTEIY